MVTTNKNFKLVRGDSLIFGFLVQDTDGNPDAIDSATFSCKSDLGDTEYVFQKTMDNGISLVEAGKYNVRIAPEDTNTLPTQKYYYDLEVTIESDVYTILIGQIDLLPDITR